VVNNLSERTARHGQTPGIWRALSRRDAGKREALVIATIEQPCPRSRTGIRTSDTGKDVATTGRWRCRISVGGFEIVGWARARVSDVI